MTTSQETMADALELLLLNQHAIAAGLEELALWIAARGAADTHQNVVTELEQLDMNAKGITAAIDRLREGAGYKAVSCNPSDSPCGRDSKAKESSPSFIFGGGGQEIISCRK